MEELALHGSQPACPPGTIPAWPECSAEERAAMERVLGSGQWWRGTGCEVEQFEQEFAAFHECRHTLAVSNGTQALEIGLHCLGVGFGDEVIVPAFTFVATATAVLSVGAVPVLADVNPGTFCLDPEAARAAVTAKTKAIMPVHLAGHPADMDAFLQLSRDTGVMLFADAAHAHGGRWKGTSLAKLVPATMYSFQNFKLLAAGEGGALVTDDDEIARHAWLRHTYGRPKGDKKYEHLELGTNCRMTEFQAAVLRPQLARFPSRLQMREEGASSMDEILGQIKGLRISARHPSVSLHPHYMYMLRIDAEQIGTDRDTLVRALSAEGVPAYRAYPAIADLDMFNRSSLWNGDVPESLHIGNIKRALLRHPIPNAQAISKDTIWLHHAVLMGGEAVQRKVGEAVRKVVAHFSADKKMLSVTR